MKQVKMQVSWQVNGQVREGFDGSTNKGIYWQIHWQVRGQVNDSVSGQLIRQVWWGVYQPILQTLKG